MNHPLPPGHVQLAGHQSLRKGPTEGRHKQDKAKLHTDGVTGKAAAGSPSGQTDGDVSPAPAGSSGVSGAPSSLSTRPPTNRKVPAEIKLQLHVNPTLLFVVFLTQGSP